jgi:hypothetical protein
VADSHQDNIETLVNQDDAPVDGPVISQSGQVNFADEVRDG